MEKRIIYNNDDGTLAIIVPSPDCGLTIEQKALRDITNQESFPQSIIWPISPIEAK